MSRRKRRNFKYKSRGKESVESRAEGGRDDFDLYLDTDAKPFKAHDGGNLIRFLPPTWEKPKHYGIDIYVHYSIGPDNNSYLCLDKMKNELCPICEERRLAESQNDDEYAGKLKYTRRVLTYLIDRDNEDDGLHIWAMPQTLDREFCKLSVDTRSGEYLEIDDPESGYDVEFDKSGKGMNTKYEAARISRNESELDNDEAMEIAADKPLTDILVYFSYEHISENLGAATSKKRDSKKAKDEKSKSNDDVTYEEVQEMDFDELEELVDSMGIDIDLDDYEENEADELADDICDELKLEKKKLSKKDKKKKMDKLKKGKRSRR